jgi:hypothetical protein
MERAEQPASETSTPNRLSKRKLSLEIQLMITVAEIDAADAVKLVLKNHYSPVMPRLTKVYLGAFQDGRLVGALTLGWGPRPRHTIQNLFPSLETGDYLEIGKMCLIDEMPTNSESQFLAGVLRWMKINLKHVRFLFTWADGTLGKPGYVYQASNFFYGGYIWTDTYLTQNGERIHPRTMGSRPSLSYLSEHRIKHIRGKLFRYIYPLNRQATKLLDTSTVSWSRDGDIYPKATSLSWQENTVHGWRTLTTKPEFNLQFVEVNSRNIERSLQLAA